MKKFTQFEEQSINENKVYNKYMELSDKLLFDVKDTLEKEGFEVNEGDKLYSFLIEMCGKIAKSAVDPKTIPLGVGEQTKLDI